MRSSMPGIRVPAHILGGRLREKSDDQTYLHAGFVKDCLDEKVDVPRELKISLLERKINEGIEGGKSGASCTGFQNAYKNFSKLKKRLVLFT